VFETFHGVLFPFPVVQWRFRGFELTVWLFLCISKQKPKKCLNISLRHELRGISFINFYKFCVDDDITILRSLEAYLPCIAVPNLDIQF
jgi:hypothetical protein